MQKDASHAQAAHKTEEKELERKAAINEKEQATSKKVEDKSESVSARALEGNQDQHKPGARNERLQTGAKDKDKDPVLNCKSTSSLLINKENMILGSQENGYADLGLNAKTKNLCDFYKEEQEEEQQEHQGKQASEGAPGEAPIIENVEERVTRTVSIMEVDRRKEKRMAMAWRKNK